MFCMHTCKYSEHIHWKKERKRRSWTQRWLVPNPRCSICCFWSKLYWTKSVHLAHAHFILCATITRLCQEVPVLRHCQCWREQGKASDSFHERRRVMFAGFFVCLEKEGCHIHLVLHCQHRRSFLTARPGQDEMLVLREDCLSVWRATHTAPQIMWPCRRANRNKTEGF